MTVRSTIRSILVLCLLLAAVLAAASPALAAADAPLPSDPAAVGEEEPSGSLTDAEGNRYSVGGRASRWGITGRQFAVYVALAIVGVVALVSVVMAIISASRRSRLRIEQEYSPAPEDDEPLDRDAIYEKLLRELLAEQAADDSQSD